MSKNFGARASHFGFKKLVSARLPKEESVCIFFRSKKKDFFFGKKLFDIVDDAAAEHPPDGSVALAVASLGHLQPAHQVR
jgi:hypothetical protein